MLVAETAATDNRLAFVLPDGFGLGTTLQLEPSQCSIKVIGAPFDFSAYPTAHTSLAEIAATE
jgi:hypothetical protein